MSFNILLCPQLSKPKEDFCVARGYRNEVFQELSEGLCVSQERNLILNLLSFLLNTQHFAPGD